MESRERLLNIYRRVYAMPRFVKTLKVIGALSVFFIAGVLLYGIGVLLYAGEYIFLAHLTAVTLVPLVAVSVMRRVINAQRPYEVFDIDELKGLRESGKNGRSFPSRHVFSAFLIGVLWLNFSVPFGVAVIILGTFLAVDRVLLGIHFVKDTVVGAAIGVVSGLIGMLFL